jgi:hypothetical protein
MTQYDLIADKIEEGIGNMFYTVQTDYSKQFAYSLLFNPKKSNTWFVVLFAPTLTTLRKALQDGTCYLLYSYLLDRFSKNEELKSIDIFTSFDSGDRPTTNEAYDTLLIALSNKLDRLRNPNESSNKINCVDCGHDFNEHQLMTLRNDESQAPKEGWIMCPVDNCTCFKTWSANYSG